MDECRRLPVEEVLELSDVRERASLYRRHQWPFEEQIRRCSKVHGNVVVLDLRPEDTIYCGNRFAVYALHLRSTLSMHVMWGKDKQNTVFAIGKSIFNRDSTLDVGRLCFQFGGGGHRNAGTCQIENGRAPRVMTELLEILARED
jgi:nanoRNase/pAp phosphatase (c-di-AMP/oligoRNAs hydrolase)